MSIADSLRYYYKVTDGVRGETYNQNVYITISHKLDRFITLLCTIINNKYAKLLKVLIKPLNLIFEMKKKPQANLFKQKTLPIMA